VHIDGKWKKSPEILKNSSEHLTHGICPECVGILYPEIALLISVPHPA